jgi:putative flavoprotein involved in K+ transport
MLEKTPTTRVQAFLDRFGQALEAGKIDGAADMFAEECFWRDLVAFTWNIRTMEGRAEIRDMLRAQLGCSDDLTIWDFHGCANQIQR